MKKSSIKTVLFVLAGAAIASPAKAQMTSADNLRLVEDLPVEQRVLVHWQVTQFLSENPDLAEIAKLIAVDSQGVVYVLDENQNSVASISQPSCGSSF